jgi:hypothetical protein
VRLETIDKRKPVKGWNWKEFPQITQLLQGRSRVPVSTSSLYFSLPNYSAVSPFFRLTESSELRS